jgi:hypothetical protein
LPGSFTKIMLVRFSRGHNDFFASSYTIFAKTVTLKIYTYCWPFRSSMPSEASRALCVRKLRTERLQVVSYPIFLNSYVAVTVHISMEQKLFCGTNRCSASKKISQISTKLRFLTVFAVLEISSCTEPTEFNLHSHIWLRELIPKSKIDGSIHFSGFTISLIHVAYNKTPPLLRVFSFPYVTSKLQLALLHFLYDIVFSIFFY